MTTRPQLSLIDDGHADALALDREYEVDRTPGAVAHQGITWAMELAGIPTGSPIVDVGAGAGVFGQQYNAISRARAWPEQPRNLAIEPRASEAEGLRRHYARVHVGMFAGFVADVLPSMRATIDTWWCASNPAFSIFPDIVDTFAEELRALLLYGSIAWGCSSAGAELFARHPPLACARVVGRVNHRGPGINPATITAKCPGGKPWGADQRDVCWWLWLRGEKPKRWSCENLPELTNAQRSWTVPPGSEDT